MAAPTITLYSGVVPNRNQPQNEFSTNVGTFLPYFDTIGPEYNVLGAWVNDQVTYIDQAIIDGQVAIDSSVAEAAQSASDAEASAVTAQSSANFKGLWSNLTGALNVPSTVEHNDKTWQLLNNLADVTLSEPGVTADWSEIKSGQEAIAVTGNFTAEAGNVYIVTGNADITIPAVAVGEIYEFHAVADTVRLLNSSYTINGSIGSISTGDDMIINEGQTVRLSVEATNTLRIS